MAIKRTATTTTSTRRTPAKATAAKATSAKATPAKATVKESTPRARHNFGAKTLVKVDKKTQFPGISRQSTKNSPYADALAGIIDTDEFLVFDGVESKEEFTSFSNTLRNLAKKNHNKALTIIWLEKATPTHPVGVYVKDNGDIKVRESK